MLEQVVEGARSRLPDVIVPGGQTLTDSQPFTIDYINLGWQKIQQILVSMGYETLEDETIITALPAMTTEDPAVQASLSWTGYNNGSGLNAGFALPQSLIRPLSLSERPSGTGLEFNPMSPCLKGLPRAPKQAWNEIWEWRADAIWMPGALMVTDLDVRFLKYLADFVAASVVPFANQVVPIMRSLNAVAAAIAYVFCEARGDSDAATLLQEAHDEAAIIVAGDSLDGRSLGKESERGKMKDRYSEGKES